MSIDAMSFGAAVELSVAMPLSWLPVIQRLYERGAEAGEGNGGKCDRVRPGELLDVRDRHGRCDLYRRVVYRGDHGESRTGIAALLIVIFSTVTTTFLDAFIRGGCPQSPFSQN